MDTVGAAMIRGRGISAVVLALLLLIACSTAQTGSSQPSPGQHSAPTSPRSASAPASPAVPGALNLNLQTLVSGVNVPWELAFLPDGRLLVTERPGDVKVITNGQLSAQAALTLSVKASPGIESGVLGLALDPHYPGQPYAYVSYTTSGNVNRVSRFTVQAGGPVGVTLTDEHPILDGIPGGQCCHFGGRIRFGPDGDLYVATGEGQVPTRSEDLSSLNGKILRLRPDGALPPDNPFPGSPVWAYGLRNPEGLAWDSAGHLYVSDNGPTGDLGLCCHDELNLITKGGFYGWPLYAGNTRTSFAAPANAPSAVPPIVESGGDVAWAPSGITFYTPRANEQATLLVAALKTERVERFVIDPANPAHVLSEQTLIQGYGRIRDISVGPDNCVYVLTSNGDGRGSGGPDRLLKGCPR